MTEAEKAVIEAFVNGDGNQQAAAEAVTRVCMERVGDETMQKLVEICNEYSTAVLDAAREKKVKPDWLANAVSQRAFEQQKAAKEAEDAAKKAAESTEAPAN